MSLAERFGLGSSKNKSTDNEMVMELEEVIEEFQQGQFQKREVRSLEDLIERLKGIKTRRLECMSKATGMDPEGKLTMYAFSLEYVSEKLAEDIITRCRLCYDPSSGSGLNFGPSKNDQLEHHMSRVSDIPNMSGRKLSKLKEKCTSTGCYGSLNESWEIYRNLKKINEEVKTLHNNIDEKSRKGRQPEWTHMDD